MESHIKKEVTRRELKKVLKSYNTGALLSVIISLRMGDNSILKENFIREIIEQSEKSKIRTELAIKSNLKLNLKIID